MYALFGAKVSHQIFILLNYFVCKSFPKVFQELESPGELEILQTHQTMLMNKRELFLDNVINSSSDDIEVGNDDKLYMLKYTLP